MKARICVLGALSLTASAGPATQSTGQVPLGSRLAPIIAKDGLRFRDLDRNGVLTPYEDWRLTPERRAADLVGRMTLDEKAGAVMHGNLPGLGGANGASSIGYDLAAASPLVLEKHITSFITRLAVTPVEMAGQNNAVQAIAEKGRLGIPVTVSTDPRHHFLYIMGQSAGGVGYSRWPETLGFGALRDPALMKRFAQVVRVEYRATGIHQALSPQADLFTDPRWARGYATFGSDPELSRTLVQAYVEGLQGGTKSLSRDGVAATVKHWVAYGATANGFDGHNRYGGLAKVDGKTFLTHLRPFDGAFAANVASVMPTYDIVEGPRVNRKPLEPVGAGFNRQLLTDLLRRQKGFRGLILSDWAITRDCNARCLAPTAQAPQAAADIAMPWGVEKLSPVQRFAKAMNAGVDQFGGVQEPEQILAAVKAGLISPQRLDEAVRRIMELKFRLGLFDNPYVDADAVPGLVNPPDVAELTFRTQAAAQVLLKNDRGILPIAPGTRVYAPGMSPDAVRAAGLVPVDLASEAAIAILRVATPFETLHPYHYIGSRQHEGRLDFRADNPDLRALQGLADKTPVVAALFLDRPAVLGPVASSANAILANFGISDDALLASLTGRFPPKGRLPFELPRSWGAVEAQDPAKPDDSRDPLFPAGWGLAFTTRATKP